MKSDKNYEEDILEMFNDAAAKVSREREENRMGLVASMLCALRNLTNARDYAEALGEEETAEQLQMLAIQLALHGKKSVLGFHNGEEDTN